MGRAGVKFFSQSKLMNPRNNEWALSTYAAALEQNRGLLAPAVIHLVDACTVPCSKNRPGR